jgi:hypothetical protein
MRPIGFHTVPRRIITVGQRMSSLLLCGALLIAGAVATVFFSPFLIGSWILDRFQRGAQK